MLNEIRAETGLCICALQAWYLYLLFFSSECLQ
jgi:hypothetical protein